MLGCLLLQAETAITVLQLWPELSFEGVTKKCSRLFLEMSDLFMHS